MRSVTEAASAIAAATCAGRMSIGLCPASTSLEAVARGERPLQGGGENVRSRRQTT